MKYGKDKKKKSIWIWNAIEAESNKCYLKKVLTRNAKTNIPVIRSQIRIFANHFRPKGCIQFI